VLTLLEPYRHPQKAVSTPLLPAAGFRAATAAAGLDIPHLSAELIKKYVADLRYLHLL
jgi:fatty acid CoA ligase FadD9